LSRLSRLTRPTSESESSGSPWSTVRATDGEKGGPNMKFGAGGQPLPAQAYQTVWPTTTVADVEGGRKSRSGARSNELLLNGLAQASPWATPAARDHKSDRSQMTSERLYGTKGRPLCRQALEASGEALSGSFVATEKRGALNPAFTCWLMGWPVEWTSSAFRAMESFSRLRRRSLKRS
jgi:hypothetical protein